MDAHIKVGAAWKKLDGIHVKVGAAWKEVEKGYIKVGGVWKQFFANFQVILSGTTGSPNNDLDVAVDPATAQAGWSFNLSGDLTKISGGAWAQPEWFGRSSETVHATPDQTYYLRATVYSGSTPSGTIGSFVALTSTRSYTWSQSGVGTTTGVLKIEIASDAGGTDIVATGYYQGTATVDA